MEKYEDEAVFCVKYLNERGYLQQEKLDELTALLVDFGVDFRFVKVRKNFYTECAERLRELWPSGNKDDKYPWRDSVDNIAKRLKILWESRNLGEYSVDDVLQVARQYLAQFENDAKYMKTLKYFIYKSKTEVTGTDGKLSCRFESSLADGLENLTDQQKFDDEWGALLGSSAGGFGELV